MPRSLKLLEVLESFRVACWILDMAEWERYSINKSREGQILTVVLTPEGKAAGSP